MLSLFTVPQSPELNHLLTAGVPFKDAIDRSIDRSMVLGEGGVCREGTLREEKWSAQVLKAGEPWASPPLSCLLPPYFGTPGEMETLKGLPWSLAHPDSQYSPPGPCPEASEPRRGPTRAGQGLTPPISPFPNAVISPFCS